MNSKFNFTRVFLFEFWKLFTGSLTMLHFFYTFNVRHLKLIDLWVLYKSNYLCRNQANLIVVSCFDKKSLCQPSSQALLFIAVVEVSESAGNEIASKLKKWKNCEWTIIWTHYRNIFKIKETQTLICVFEIQFENLLAILSNALKSEGED